MAAVGDLQGRAGKSMLPRRLQDIPGFSIDRVAAAAGNDPDVLRMENLDTDLKPPRAAIEATRAALESQEANSYLPFTGRLDLRTAIADRLHRQTKYAYGGLPAVGPKRPWMSCLL